MNSSISYAKRLNLIGQRLYSEQQCQFSPFAVAAVTEMSSQSLKLLCTDQKLNGSCKHACVIIFI